MVSLRVYTNMVSLRCLHKYGFSPEFAHRWFLLDWYDVTLETGAGEVLKLAFRYSRCENSADQVDFYICTTILFT